MDQSGADAVQLLGWVKKLSDPAVVQGAKVALLQRVLGEQFENLDQATPRQREAQPTGAVHNPHEPEAQWAAKGTGRHRKEHVGYKVQVCETVVSEEPVAKGEPTRNFIDDIITQPATASEKAGMALVEAEQAKSGAEPPPKMYVDAGYVSARKLAEAQEQGTELIGPAPGPPRKAGRFSAEDFTVEIQKRQAVCPAGKTSTQCSELKAKKTGRISYRFEWSTHCHECPLREKCLGKKDQQKHRTLLVGEHHDLLQARRREQKTKEFQQRCHPRNALEGTMSELGRGHGMKRARYRGLAKVSLQNLFIGAACNVKRWIRRVQWDLQQASRSAEAVLLSG
jgi:hypothetical protein